MILECATHPQYRSNTYLLADAHGGDAVFIDAGGPVERLMQCVDEHALTVTHVLLTHEHRDHTVHAVDLEERYGARAVYAGESLDGTPVAVGRLTLRPLSTPGHCEPHVAWLVERDGRVVAAFTGDVLFRETVGGTVSGGPEGFERLRASIDALLALPDDAVLYPGHVDATTVAHEREHNPFVRAWRGDGSRTDEPVQVAGTAATLLLEARDYDGGTKAWVRFADGREAVVGGSMVSRAPARA